ncbi:hypothetical protein COB21_03360 [Candidatus Aerophobetes bacterium]|uniref:MOMP family protein n=1 Tax=Aerophobetes bacterium TaxID=2030807 RepID=A0A2A4X577_UNCAE|nr:MAG: hypothetical protein COB21_03360 [Candidatus Aerophobetes bacterium]
MRKKRMNFSTVKRISLAAFSLAALSSVALSADSRVDTLDRQMKEVGTGNAKGTFGARTAPERYEVNDGSHWFVGFDVLYWKSNFSNNDYVQGSTDPAAGLPNVGEVYNIGYDWDWGVKARLGYQFDHDNWDTSIRYNWFSSSAGNSQSAGLGQSLLPLRTVGDEMLAGVIPGSNAQDFDFCTRAVGNGSFNFQTLDWDLSRAFFTSSKLSFRPNIGLRSAWIKINEKVEYTGGTPVGTTFGLADHAVYENDDCKTWGIGPRIGADSKWHLGRGFSIFGDVSASLVYTYFKMEHFAQYSEFPTTNYMDVTASDHQFVPNVDLFLGVRWDSCINKNQQHIGIGLGWDTQYWWSQYRRMVKNTREDGNLSLRVESQNMSIQGISLTVDVDF